MKVQILKDWDLVKHIPEEVLRAIQQAANIRQIVEEYVPLKKSGRNWIGLCPFHADKDPSFSVSEEKQLFYCFGCGEGGNVFKFLMKMTGMSFTEAARHLANRYGIQIPQKAYEPRVQKRLKEKKLLIEINQLAADYFHHKLTDTTSGQKALSYLKNRGIGIETIERFRLGWAEDSWDDLIRFLKAQGKDLEAASQAGLIVKKDSGTSYYDRFRARITFPILDDSGQVVAIGGRLIENGRPKYLNSPESPVYSKSNVLYGLYRNKGAIRRSGLGFVVEGYMDLIALVQYGVDQVVATLGTSLTQEHATRMKYLTKDWTLVFDSDSAGLKAALRALPVLYQLDIRPRVLILPEGEDPDSFVRENGAQAWQLLAQEARSGIDFALEYWLNSLGKDPEGRTRTIEQILPILEAVKDPIRRSLLIGHVAQRIGVREKDLWDRLDTQEKVLKPRAKPDPRAITPISPSSKNTQKRNLAEEKVLSFVLSQPHFFEGFMETNPDIWLEDKKLTDLYLSMVHVYSMASRLDLEVLMQHLSPSPKLKELATRLRMAFLPCEDPEIMYHELILYCNERKKKALRQQLIQRLREVREEDQMKLLQQLERLR